jgi:hypothetical protein
MVLLTQLSISASVFISSYLLLFISRSEPPIYGTSKKIAPKVPPKPSLIALLDSRVGQKSDVINIMNLPKSDTKEYKKHIAKTSPIRNITHV